MPPWFLFLIFRNEICRYAIENCTAIDNDNTPAEFTMGADNDDDDDDDDDDEDDDDIGGDGNYSDDDNEF